MSLFVLENTEASHQRKLFTVLGVDCVATSRAWIHILLAMILGTLVALISAPADPLLARIGVGIVYGILIVVSAFCHALGHILSSRMVQAPMKSFMATATVYVTHYEDVEEYPSRVHVGRALGGPVLNLALGLVALAVYGLAVKSHFLLFFGAANLVVAVFTLCPIPSLDGAVILRELRKWRK